MSVLGQSQPVRADSKSAVVRYGLDSVQNPQCNEITRCAITGLMWCSKHLIYSITSSAKASSVGDQSLDQLQEL
jgi:hypothetical protein